MDGTAVRDHGWSGSYGRRVRSGIDGSHDRSKGGRLIAHPETLGKRFLAQPRTGSWCSSRFCRLFQGRHSRAPCSSFLLPIGVEGRLQRESRLDFESIPGRTLQDKRDRARARGRDSATKHQPSPKRELVSEGCVSEWPRMDRLFSDHHFSRLDGDRHRVVHLQPHVLH